jgi:uncharacterized protein with HEPN domain
MSGQRDESLLLGDIIDASERLIELGSRVVPGHLGVDREINEMMLWNVMVLGEATKRLRPFTRERFMDVPWTELARMRDRVSHHYEGIDWPVVALTIEGDLPALLPRFIAIRDVLRAEADAG